MSIEIKNLTITIDGITYTGKVERVEPDRRLILSISRRNDEGTPDRVMVARIDTLSHVIAKRFPAIAPQETHRNFADFDEWIFTIINAKREHIEWAKDASRCGLINNYILDYDPASGGEK